MPIIYTAVQTGSNYDVKTGMWTAPHAGACQVSAIVSATGVLTSTWIWLTIEKNGVYVLWGEYSFGAGGLTCCATLSRAIEVTAGDTLKVVFGASYGGGQLVTNDYTAASFLLIPAAGAAP